MANNSSEPPHELFYETYKDSGRSPMLIMLHGGRWLISMVGLALNVVLVTATIKSKKLHNRCNILIAAEATANALYQLSPSIAFVLALDGNNLIPLDRCLLLQMVPLFGVHVSLFCSFFIGMDRLLSIKFPTGIAKFKGVRYVFALLAISVTYAVLYLAECFHLCKEYIDTQIMVMCTITLDCFQGLQVETKCLYSAIILNVAIVCVYIMLWHSVKQSAGKISAENAKNPQMFTQRILKSLMLITYITIFGWTAATGARVLIQYLPFNEIQSVLFINYISYLTNLTSSSSAPVLYLCSEEYRKAFLQLFGLAAAQDGKSTLAIRSSAAVTVRNSQNALTRN